MNFQWSDKGIEWTDATLNVVTGCLSTEAQCAVAKNCYARRTAERLAGRAGYPEYPNHFQPTFHPERLGEPSRLKKPAKIFLSSMGELLGPWVPKEWLEAILCMVEENPRHTFQFLTKYPQGYQNIIWPQNTWVGTTINSNADSWRLEVLRDIIAPVRFVSAEPLFGPIDSIWGIDLLIVGAQTKPAVQPEREWVEDLLAEADKRLVKVFMKSNLKYEPRRRELPSV